MMSNSGPINYVKILLRTLLLAFVCNTFQITSTTYIMHFEVTQIDLNVTFF